MNRQTHIFDAETQFRTDGLAARTASAAEAGVLDFGDNALGISGNTAFNEGLAVARIQAMDSTAGDETADLVVQLSDNASGSGLGFQAGDNVVARAVIHVGAAIGAEADDDFGLGEVIVGVSNDHKGQLFRFMRMATVVGGTSPSIQYTAYLAAKN